MEAEVKTTKQKTKKGLEIKSLLILLKIVINSILGCAKEKLIEDRK